MCDCLRACVRACVHACMCVSSETEPDLSDTTIYLVSITMCRPKSQYGYGLRI